MNLNATLIKQELRFSLKAKLNSLSKDYKLNAQNLIYKHLQNFFMPYKKIVLYYPMHDEINILPLAQKLNLQYDFYAPVVYKKTKMMSLEKYSFRKKDSLFALEQDNSYLHSFYDIDFVLIPLLGYDRWGYRLGRGGGYYDTTLQGLKNKVFCGIGYDFQCISNLPHETWDIKLTHVINETGVINFKI